MTNPTNPLDPTAGANQPGGQTPPSYGPPGAYSNPPQPTPPQYSYQQNNAVPEPNGPYATNPVNPYAGPPIGAFRAEDVGPASMAHYLVALPGFLSFIGPLAIMMSNGKTSPAVRAEAAKALNFAITAIIGYVICGVIGNIGYIWWIGSLGSLAIWISTLLFGIQGGTSVKAGKPYTYPFALSLVK